MLVIFRLFINSIGYPSSINRHVISVYTPWQQPLGSLSLGWYDGWSVGAHVSPMLVIFRLFINSIGYPSSINRHVISVYTPWQQPLGSLSLGWYDGYLRSTVREELASASKSIYVYYRSWLALLAGICWLHEFHRFLIVIVVAM